LVTSDRALLDLVGRIYDAALRPDGWADVLRDISDHTGSQGVVLHVETHFSGEEWGRHRVHNIEPAYLASHRDYYFRVDPRVHALLSLDAGVRPGDSLLPASEFARTEYGADWWQPQGVAASFVGHYRRGGGLSGLSGARSAHKGDYLREELALVEELFPHIRRALELESVLGEAVDRDAPLDELIEHMGIGLVLLDAEGRVVRTNGFADRACHAEDGLRVSRGELVLSDPEAQRTYQRAVAGALAPAEAGARQIDWIAARRPSGLRGWALTVDPLGPETGGELGDVAVAVTIRDPELGSRPDPQALMRLWDLSRAEATAAVRVIELGGVPAAAASLGVQANTIRAHLKKVYEKTETGGQIELATLVLRALGLGRKLPEDA